MIITEQIWNESKNDIVNVSTALSYKKIGPRFEDSWNLFFIPLFGGEICRVIEESDDPEVTKPARRALAHLTFWQFFDEMNVRITDQGFQRQESDTFKTVYKYQSDNLKQGYKNAGFNALELLLNRLDAKLADNEQWKNAPCCQYRKRHIVQSMAEVDAVYDIHRSYIIYLALRQDIAMMEQVKAPAILGAKLHQQLMKNIAEDVEEIGSTTTEELRLRLSAVIVLMSIKRYIERTGSITDRGFYYVIYKPETGNNEQVTAVSMNNKAVAVAQIEQDISSLTAALNFFIDTYLGDFRESDYSHTVRRDNNGKHTFFA